MVTKLEDVSKEGEKEKGRGRSSGEDSEDPIGGGTDRDELHRLTRFGRKLFTVGGFQFQFRNGSTIHAQKGLVEECRSGVTQDQERGTLSIQSEEDLAHAAFLQTVFKEYIEAKPVHSSVSSFQDASVPRRARLNKLSLLVANYEALQERQTSHAGERDM